MNPKDSSLVRAIRQKERGQKKGLTWNSWWGLQVFSVEMLDNYFAFLRRLHPGTAEDTLSVLDSDHPSKNKKIEYKCRKWETRIVKSGRLMHHKAKRGQFGTAVVVMSDVRRVGRVITEC